MITVTVELGERSYPIYIDQRLLGDAGILRRHIRGRQLLIVSNETVAPLYLPALRGCIGDDYRVSEVILPDGEEFKTLAVLERIPLETPHNPHNQKYLATKAGKLGHLMG